MELLIFCVCLYSAVIIAMCWSSYNCGKKYSKDEIKNFIYRYKDKDK